MAPTQRETEMQMKSGLDDAGAPGEIISQEIASFIQSGVSIIVGVVGADGRARAGRALASRVMEGGIIRLIYPEEGNSVVTAAAQSGGQIAVTFSAPLSHRTIQIKGVNCRTEALGPEDRISADFQSDVFAAVLIGIGYPSAFVSAFCDYRATPLSVLSFSVRAAFEQTPGPGAGRSI
jgi:hypothetical protein